ncbi:MAG: branched-chain amino acid ABC transporter permease [Chloroflexi bacterium]|nr:branched-chain amino acid ABC transporter permease [Chloroflexota bacterium]
MEHWIIQSANALSFASILFLLAAGFSITFGMMRVLNMAHASFFFLGAYIGMETLKRSHNFLLALVVASLFMGLAGLATYRFFLRRFSREEEFPQALLTIGVLLVASEVVRWTWGGRVYLPSGPTFATGSIALGGLIFPKYRLFLIAVGAAVSVVLWVLLTKTRLGALVRATADDAEMSQGLGVNTRYLFMGVFGLGAMLAGFGGVLAAPVLGLYSGLDWEALLLAVVVVIVGGVGSFYGLLVGSLAVAFVDTFTRWFMPELAWFTIFLPVALILAFRPHGLMGKPQ